MNKPKKKRIRNKYADITNYGIEIHNKVCDKWEKYHEQEIKKERILTHKVRSKYMKALKELNSLPSEKDILHITNLTGVIRNHSECELDYGTLQTLKMIDDEVKAISKRIRSKNEKS